MKKASLITRLRAAYSLSNSISAGSKPNTKALTDLGLDSSFANHFRR